MRAFLSHSSADKAIVDQVAKRLGRAYVVYDRYAFEAGDDIKAAIIQGLNKSELFVLFASKNALSSKWVEFEQTEAERRFLRANIKRFLVFLLDSHLTVDDLPIWLQSAIAIHSTSPALIANEIQRKIQNNILDKQNFLFINRQREIEESTRLLAPIRVDQAEPTVFLFFGLDGVGRRTLCRKIAEDLFNYRGLIAVKVEDGDSLSEVWLKTWEQLHPAQTIDEARKRKENVLAASVEEAIQGQLELIEETNKSNHLIVLHDKGGLLDNDGFVQAGFSSFLATMLEQNDGKLAIISRRRPQFEPSIEPLPEGFPCIAVKELSTEHTKTLMSRLARDEGVSITQSQLSELAEYVRGFPPAAYYTNQLIKSYNPDMILSNKAPIVNFRVSIFLQYLQNDKNISSDRQRLLVLLANYSPLPLKVMANYGNLDASAVHEHLKYLIDASLVRPSGNHYTISEPIVEAVLRAFPNASTNHHKFSDVIEQYLSDVDDDDAKLDLARSLYRASKISGRGESEAAIGLIGDSISLTKDFYHQRDYKRAIETANEVLAIRPDSVDIRSYLARAYIQEEMFDDAMEQIEEIHARGNQRDAYFLEGFLERHRGDFERAIIHYNNALEHGRKGVAIHRELAQCYFEVGNLDKATHHIGEAHQRDPDNRYVIDLEVKIAVRQRDEDAAQQRLKDLQFVDNEEWYYHRKSTVDLAFQRYDDALVASKEALRLADRPSFAMLSQFVNCLIHCGHFSEAAGALGELDKTFSRSHHDHRVGLRCKLEIRRRKYRDALGLWNRLRAKGRPVHQALVFRAIEGLVLEGAASDAEKRLYEDLLLSIAEEDREELEMYVGSDFPD